MMVACAKPEDYNGWKAKLTQILHSVSGFYRLVAVEV